jgi:hypothetical protein
MVTIHTHVKVVKGDMDIHKAKQKIDKMRRKEDVPITQQPVLPPIPGNLKPADRKRKQRNK